MQERKKAAKMQSYITLKTVAIFRSFFQIIEVAQLPLSRGETILTLHSEIVFSKLKIFQNQTIFSRELWKISIFSNF